MGWRPAVFKDQRVHAEVGPDGELAVRDGRVAIRYSAAAGAKVYRAGASRVHLVPGTEPVDLPDGVDADAAPARPAAAASATGGGAARGSGFGKAGTRSAAQASAAAADARERLAALPPETVLAFTDGACRGNPGPAGSGAVVVLPDGRRAEASRALGRATNNIAELTAIGMALELLDAAGLPPDAPVALFSDSSYARGVLTQGWKARANVGLVEELKRAIRARPGLRLHWVAGHVGVEGNERADQLANRGVSGITETVPFGREPR